MPSIIFVARPLPADIGPGGRHRSYQIEYELKAAVGADRVQTLSLMDWQHREGTAWGSFRQRTLAGRAMRRISDCLENPLAVLHGTGYGARRFAPAGFVAEYRQLISRSARPIVTVIDDPRFAAITDVAEEAAVPVIACPHNLESLDLAASDSHGAWGLRTHLVDLANELGHLQRCAGRLCISKVETGLVSGLGLEAEHYPYLPVGAIRDRLAAIRTARRQTARDAGLVLVLGSAMHGTTHRAFEWFLERARSCGLPAGIRLVLAGAGTEMLDLRGMAGVEALGWVSQPDLDRLLTKAGAVVVPQCSGFGSVTRLVELSCAGVPSLVPPHPVYAIDVPPGVHVLGHLWHEWQDQLRDLAGRTRRPEWDYEAWEATQPRPLPHALARWIREE